MEPETNDAWLAQASKFVIIEGNEAALTVLRARGVAPYHLDDGMIKGAKADLDKQYRVIRK